MTGYRLRQAARADLLDIYLYGLERFGLRQADIYHESLEKAFSLIAQYPRATRERSEIIGPVRAYPCGVHLIIYELGSHDEVEIIRIRHSREDWLSDS